MLGISSAIILCVHSGGGEVWERGCGRVKGVSISILALSSSSCVFWVFVCLLVVVVFSGVVVVVVAVVVVVDA